MNGHLEGEQPRLGDLQFTIVANDLLMGMILKVGPCEKHLSKSHHFGENRRNVEFQGWLI